MSIDDLTSMDLTPLVVILVVLSILVLPVVLLVVRAMRKKANNNIYGDDEYGVIKEEKNAKIIARRTTPHPMNQAVAINMVVFEFANGGRIELAIKDPNTYGIMVVGDCGTLKYIGKKFVGFERGSNKEKISKDKRDSESVIFVDRAHTVPVRISKDGTGKTVCPVCGTEQNDNRYCCFHCSTPFINKQPGIDYWCSNCGFPGPFDGSCPKCNSDKKLMNY